MPTTILDTLNDAVSEVSDAINAVTSYVDEVISVAEDVAKTYNRALGAIRFAGLALQQYRRRIASLSNSVAIMSESTFSMGSKYILSSYVGESYSASLSLSSLMAELRRRFAALASSLPLARHYVRDGETLQSISVRWYGTAEEWKRIYDHNRLTTTVLTVGATLEVPRL
jgi:hypothetical protein